MGHGGQRLDEHSLSGQAEPVVVGAGTSKSHRTARAEATALGRPEVVKHGVEEAATPG